MATSMLKVASEDVYKRQAVGLCSNFTLIFSVMSDAVGTVAGILIAQCLGAEEHTEAWRSFDGSLVCGGVLAALFLRTAGCCPAQVLGLYTADDAILRVGAGYFLSLIHI